MFWNSIKSTRVIKEWTFTGLKCRTLKPSFTFTFYFLLWQAKLPVHMSKKSSHFPKLLCSHVSIRPQNKCKIFQIYINYCDFKWKRERSSFQKPVLSDCDLFSEALQNFLVSWILWPRLFRKTSLRTQSASGASLIKTSRSNVLRVPGDTKAPPTVISLFHWVPS